MKEYITKDRAKQFVCGHCNEVCSEEPCEPSDCDWMAFIDKEPAADVVEVKHGRWIDTGYHGYSKKPIFQCSECHGEVEDYFIKNHKFCLHCGAKMDKEDCND